MHCVRKVTENLYWIGANDQRITLFENIHPTPRGISYNAYLLLDKKTVLFDTVDWSACRQFLENIEYVLAGRPLDYLIINHIEPDHGASIAEVLLRYPEVKLLSTKKAVVLMQQFGFNINDRIEEVKDGDTKSFGKHVLEFLTAPMVHWPEVMVTFDKTNGVLFSADAFGTFGTLDGKLFNDEMNFDRDWIDDARRYYANIIGKYGTNVQALLKKIRDLDIKIICSLHGPVWRNNLEYFLNKYDKWSNCEPEEKGIMIVFSSMYGNTENAASVLASILVEKGITNVVMYDVSRTDVSYLISETFRCSHVVLASVTYNMGIYPKMHNYLIDMKALNLHNRTFAILENGSWACKSGTLIRTFLENEMKSITVLGATLTLTSTMKENNIPEVKALADNILNSIK